MSRLRPFALEFVIAVLVLGLGGAVGLLLAGSEADFQAVDEDLANIRTEFNADTDNVRAVLLASPT